MTASPKLAPMTLPRAIAAGVAIAAVAALAELAAIVASSTLVQAVMGPPFGVQYSINGWLRSQLPELALELLVLSAIGALSGAALSLGMALFFRRGRYDEKKPSAFYFYFLLGAVIVILASPAVRWGGAAEYFGGGLKVVGYVLIDLVIICGLWLKLKKVDLDRAGVAVVAIRVGAGVFFFFALWGLTPWSRDQNELVRLAVWLGLALGCYGAVRLKELALARFHRLARFSWRLAAAGVAFLLLGSLYLALRSPGVPTGAASAGPGGRNVILIVLDTVRADHLSLYGYQRPTTPTLEALAKSSLVFNHAFSTAPWTLPSHASFFTGLYPAEHGCHNEHLYLDGRFATLAEIFQARGYATLGYSNNPIVGRMSNLDQGFEVFVEGWRDDHSALKMAEAAKALARLVVPQSFPTDAGAAQTGRVVGGWLDELARSDSPFFLFVNYMEAHPPLIRHPESYRFFASAEEGEQVLDSIVHDHVARTAGRGPVTPAQTAAILAHYDAEIAYLDAEIGRLLSRLETLGLSERTAVAIVSDHGEMFDEHGGLWGHERTLYQSLLHVPLLIHAPGLVPAGRELDAPVSLRELFQMALALSENQGTDAVLAASRAPDLEVWGGIVAEVYRPLSFMNVCAKRFPGYDVAAVDRRQRALIDYPWKLIWDSKGDNRLFHLEEDPGELFDRLAAEPERGRRMMASLLEYDARRPVAGTAAIPSLDPETVKRLRELGYLP